MAEETVRPTDSQLDILAGQAYHKFIARETIPNPIHGTEPYTEFHAAHDVVDEALIGTNPRDLFEDLIADSEISARELMSDILLEDFFVHPETETDLDDFFNKLCRITVRHQLELRYPQIKDNPRT